MSLIALKRGAAEMRLPFAVSQDYFFDSLCASSLIGCVEDVSYLVLHHSFDGVSGRSQILSRIEVLRGIPSISEADTSATASTSM